MNKAQFKRDELAWELRHEDAAMGYPNRYNNPVAKYAHRYNKASVVPNKKKEVMNGYSKHKDQY